MNENKKALPKQCFQLTRQDSQGVFWGVSEPLSHFLSPDGMEGGTAEAADFAIKATFMHWGLHPWAIYGVIGLAIAYFGFRKGEKNLISSSFIPVIGREKAEGVFGKAIDIITVFITIMGISTSLGPLLY